jgi:hypothetical protein
MKHCKEHDLYYDNRLYHCPICIGAALKGTLINRIYTKDQNEHIQDTGNGRESTSCVKEN